MKRQRLPVIASREGYNKEQLHIHDVSGNKVYMSVDTERDWYKLHYEIVPDGYYNQSVKSISLPYIVYQNDVYSIDTFRDWSRN